MALSKPVIKTPIAAFDATFGTTVYYDVVGGDLPTKNKFQIISNLGTVIYTSSWTSTYNNYITIPSGIGLQNGQSYFITVQTGTASATSATSNQVQFYCYTTPTFIFTNVSSVIPSSTYTFSASYQQSQNELLNTYIFTLYNAQNVVVATSGVQYASGLTPQSGAYTLSYNFGGLLDGQTFKIGLQGETVQHTILTIEPVQFSVSYEQQPMLDVLSLTNICNEGTVRVDSTLKVYQGRSSSTVTYINNDEADLRNNMAVWEKVNLNVESDFTLYLKFRGAAWEDGEWLLQVYSDGGSFYFGVITTVATAGLQCRIIDYIHSSASSNKISITPTTSTQFALQATFSNGQWSAQLSVVNQ